MTEPEYWAHLDAIAIKFPQHDMLDTFRSGGYTALNRIMVAQVVEKLRAKVDGQLVEDPLLTSLHIQKTRLYRTRAKLSNTLEDCPTDRKRYQIVAEIDVTQNLIAKVQEQIRRAEAGESIRVAQDARNTPESALQLHKRLANCRSMRSRARAKLKKLESLPNRRLNEKAIEKTRNRIDDLNAEIERLERYGQSQ